MVTIVCHNRRVALDNYVAQDAAMQQAIRESDERLKAMYSSV